MFSVDGKLYAALSLIADVVIVNLLVLLSLLSVVGGGGGIAAGYHVFTQRIAGYHQPLWPLWWDMWKQTWTRALPVWIGYLALIVLGLYELALLNQTDGGGAVEGALRAAVIVGIGLCTGIVAWFLLLLPRTSQTVVRGISLAIMSAIAQLPRTAGMVLAAVIPLVLASTSLPMMLRVIGFMLAVGVGLVMYLQTLCAFKPLVGTGINEVEEE